LTAADVSSRPANPHIMAALDECGLSQWRKQGFRTPCVVGGSVFRESHKRTAY